jgi:hypothetical protein
MLYEIEVRPRSGTEYFQIYTEIIEALTSQDALAKVQRRNPGCQVTLCRSWSKAKEPGSRSDYCFIATAAYGTAENKSVEILRKWRDQALITSKAGRSIVNIYYFISPPIARLLSKSPMARRLTRCILKPLIIAIKAIYTEK